MKIDNLKFRYWDNLINKYVYSDDYGFSDPAEKLRSFFQNAAWYSNGEIEKYSGFKDTNNKPIFEGDIVEADIQHEQYKIGQLFEVPLARYTNGEINYFNAGFYVCEQYIGATELYKYACCDEHGIALRIIGNKRDAQN